MSNKPPLGNVVSRIILVAVASIWISACSQEAVEPATSPAPIVGTTTEYKWYMEGMDAGHSTVKQSGDGLVSEETFMHWNNREYTRNSEIQLDSDGLLVSLRVNGTSAFGAPIDETFSLTDGIANWQTPGENGSAEVDAPAIYVSPDLPMETLAAIIRAASESSSNEIALLPSGNAQVKKLTTTSVRNTGGPVNLSLYAITGLGFTATYVWLDDSLQVGAIDYSGFMGMIREGSDYDALSELSSLQSEESARFTESQSVSLAHKLDQALIFEHVGVVDVEAGKLLEDRHVQIIDGKIAAISESPIEQADAIRVDGSGKTLMPGMWDMHGHFDLADGALNIAGGITSVRDIGNVHEKIMELTEKFDKGIVIGPNTYRSGFMDQVSPYASGDAVKSLEEALEKVDFFAEHGYMQVKLYSSIDPSWVAPIAERTHSHGMRLSGHIPAFMSAEQAVRAGYDEIQHINMVFLNFLAGDREDTRKQIRFNLYGDKAGELDLDSDAVEEFIALLKENDVVVDPTAAIFDTMVTHMPGEPDPSYSMIIDHLPGNVSRAMYNPDFDIGEDRQSAWAKSAVAQAAMIRKLYESGIQLVPGSDAYAAFTIHRELELYVEAGIPNAAVLKIATLDSARIVGVDDITSSIKVGKNSDLVLLDGNPLEDISAIRRATLVMKGNTIYRPDELFKANGVKPFVESATF